MNNDPNQRPAKLITTVIDLLTNMTIIECTWAFERLLFDQQLSSFHHCVLQATRGARTQIGKYSEVFTT